MKICGLLLFRTSLFHSLLILFGFILIANFLFEKKFLILPIKITTAPFLNA
jgi:hypothetical protein